MNLLGTDGAGRRVCRIARPWQFWPLLAGPIGAFAISAISRGASATFPCLECKNVTAKGDKGLVGADTSGYLVDITCPDARRFDRHTSEEVYEKCDILSVLHSRVNKTAFAEAQKRFGFTYNPYGVLWDEDLRDMLLPMEVNRVDPAHSFICDGMVQKELSGLFCCLKESGIEVFPKLRELGAAKWRTCRSIGGPSGSVDKTFSEAREKYFKDAKNDHRVAGGASEILASLPVIRFFLDSDPDVALALGPHALERQSFEAMYRVMTIYVKGKAGFDVADSLEAALQDHGEKKLAAYGEELFIPKDHYAKHIPRQIRKDKHIFDALVAERFHIVSKSCMEAFTNPARFEKESLIRLVARHVELLNDGMAFCTGLYGKIRRLEPPGFPAGSTCKAGRSLVLRGTSVEVDDIIRLSEHGQPVEVKLCVEIDDMIGFLGHNLAWQRQAANSVYRRNAAPAPLLPPSLPRSPTSPFAPRLSLPLVHSAQPRPGPAGGEGLRGAAGSPSLGATVRRS